MSGLVQDMYVLRDRGLSAFDLVPMVHREGDGDITTGLDHLRFLTYGSPKLRFILGQINHYVLPTTSGGKARKLILTDDVPLTAYFWEMVLNSICVETAVLHARVVGSRASGLDSQIQRPGFNLIGTNRYISGEFSGSESRQVLQPRDRGNASNKLAT
jgi:hypothetical protein